MPENIGSASGSEEIYNTSIPQLSENADIQTAFRLYHYGEDTNTPSRPFPENSIVSHLDNLNDSKINKLPKQLNGQDLNGFAESGFYIQESNPIAGAPNYPSAFAGLLTVVSNITEGIIFQQYQVIGASEGGTPNRSQNKTWWRFYFGGTWRSWRTFVDSDTLPSLLTNYYTRLDVDTTFLTIATAASTYITQAEADARLYLLENVQTGNYTLQLSDLNKVIAVNNVAPATITIPTNSVAFPIGSVVNVYAMTDQSVTIAPENETVQVRNAGVLFEQYTEISLRKRGLNEWVASGNIL